MRGTPWAPSKRVSSLPVEFHLVGGFATLGVVNCGKGCQIDGYTGVSGLAWLILWISGFGMIRGALGEAMGGVLLAKMIMTKSVLPASRVILGK